MFEKWGFLLTEIWVLLALAALIGLFAGWLIWGRRSDVVVNTGNGDEAARLRADLAACQTKGRDLASQNAALQADLAKAKAATTALEAAAPPARTPAAPVIAAASLMAAPPAPAAEPAAEPVFSRPASLTSAVEAAAPSAASKPQTLTGARGGKADDLKLVKGIGPKLEALCNKLGFYHFDQIASWTEAEIAWVDENLEGFKGRVQRDEWVVQARDLAAGKAPRAGGEN